MGSAVSDLRQTRTDQRPISVAPDAVTPFAAGGRQRVLLLSTWHPVPADNGRKQRTLGMINALQHDFDVVLVSLLPASACEAGGHATVQGVHRSAVLPLPTFDSRSYRSLIAGLRRRPRSTIAVWDSATATAIVDIARSTGAVVAIGTDLRTLEYLQYLRSHVDGITTILDEPDVSPFVANDDAPTSLSSIRARLRHQKYAHFLTSTACDLDAVLVAAEHEVHAYRTLSGGRGAIVVPNGVHRFPAPWRPTGSTALLYTGSLTYEPNIEAVTWYERSILPLLRTQVACPILHVTGTLPDTIPDRIKHPAFRLTGRVDDLDPIFQASGVFVAPILSGTGTRVKILEALAYGIPVVTTSKGCEGIPLVPGRDALVADTPEAFTLAIIRILRDADFAQTLGANGRAFVERNGNWRSSAEQLRSIVAELLNVER